MGASIAENTVEKPFAEEHSHSKIVAEHVPDQCLQKGNIEDADADAQGKQFKEGDDDTQKWSDNELGDKSQRACVDKAKKWFGNKFEDDEKSLEVFADKANK